MDLVERAVQRAVDDAARELRQEREAKEADARRQAEHDNHSREREQ